MDTTIHEQTRSSKIGAGRNMGASGIIRLLAGQPWHRFALAGTLLLSAFLGFFRLNREGYSNLYYAATVRSMLTSWHNFFYASYDPGGFVTVDKPPLGLWVQAASAWLFGFHGISLLLPQVLAGILSVALLYHLVRRAFGPGAGVLAALVLAVVPINVATNRNNTMDSLLVLVVLAAAWAVFRATESGRLRWLLLCAVLVGLGFNIKMLQAYLVLPAFWLLYLVAAPLRWWKRGLHLAVATLVLLAVSLSWAIAVDLTPANRRPYIGGSSSNTVMDLIVGYNGLNRLRGGIGGLQIAPLGPMAPITPGQQAGGQLGPMVTVTPGQQAEGQLQATFPAPGGQAILVGGGAPGGENGRPGPLRLLNRELAGQVGWLLPLAVLGLFVAAWPLPRRATLSRQHQSLLLWGMWLLTCGAFFSVATFYHRYYLVMLSPAIAALVGAGVPALWRGYRRQGWSAWLLPGALVGEAALQAYILAPYPDWSRRLAVPIVGVCLAAAAVLVVARRKPALRLRTWTAHAAIVGVAMLLVAPMIWGAIPVWTAPGDPLPSAGPNMFASAPVFPGAPRVVPQIGSTTADPKLISYLRANRGQAAFLVATESAGEASPLILATGEPVMALGGFGADKILTTDQLAARVRDGQIRFFLVAGTDPPVSPGTGGQANRLVAPPENDAGEWVREHCARVPEELWQSTPQGSSTGNVAGMLGHAILFDCGSQAR